MSNGDQARELQRQDLVVLGARIRDARKDAGLGQSDVAEAVGVSISYVSRIEAGKRRCDLALLTRIAERLEVTVEGLLRGDPDEAADDPAVLRRVELEFVAVALEMGDAQSALDRLDALRTDPTVAPTREELHLRGRAFEGLGQLTRAIEVLEQIQLPGPEPLADVPVAIALSRCYRESGEAVRAIRVGEVALEALRTVEFEGSDEAVQLAVTVAAAYFEQGDREYAVRLCRRTAAAAERGGSPAARASAYWNYAVVELENGDAEGAVRLARRAVALLGEGQDEANLGRLRAQLALMEMRLSPPELDEAEEHLQSARASFVNSGARQLDLHKMDAAMARLALLRGNPDLARRLALGVSEELGGSAPQVVAEALVVAGEASAELGEPDQARAQFLRAVGLLAGADDLRSVAQMWLDLGNRLQSLGEVEAAADAFRRAAVAAGLNPSAATATSRTR